MRIIDGKSISRKIISEVSEEVEVFVSRHGIVPTLAVINIGRDNASEIYLKAKEKAAKSSGINMKKFFYNKMENSEIQDLIVKLNDDKNIHGILVQLPLPDSIDTDKILSAISPLKDVDGLTPYNMGKVVLGQEDIAPCTPSGIISIMEEEGIELAGRHVVIINHSVLIGKPLAMMLLKRNATVSVCHHATKNIETFTKKADIIITATGVSGLIKGDMIKKKSVIIDAGISIIDGNVAGDVDFKSVSEKASAITPVPGGVGPVTVAALMRNTLNAAKRIVEN